MSMSEPTRRLVNRKGLKVELAEHELYVALWGRGFYVGWVSARRARAEKQADAVLDAEADQHEEGGKCQCGEPVPTVSGSCDRCGGSMPYTTGDMAPHHHVPPFIAISFAAEHMARLGYTLLARAYRTHHGTISIVAQDGRTLVFCQVYELRSPTPGALFERKAEGRALAHRQAAAWMADNDWRAEDRLIRFDAISVTFDDKFKLVKLDHLENV